MEAINSPSPERNKYKNIMEDKPQIKLLTLWQLDLRRREWYGEPDPMIITHGIWETSGVEITDKGRLYTMTLRMPGFKTQKVGDEIKMLEWLLVEFCHEVKIVSQPKLPSMVKSYGTK